MTFIRSLIFMLFLAIYTVVMGVICLAVFFLPYSIRRIFASCWACGTINMAKIICGIDYEVLGEENFPKEPCVILSKHQSAWETLFLYYALKRPVVYVLKKSLLYIPFFGWGLSLYHMIPIDRSQGVRALRQVIAEGKDRLNRGQSIIIFPEGTRTSSGEKLKYQASGTRLAIENHVNVTPIALNSGECWSRNAFLKKAGKITVSVGPSISSEGKTADSMMAEVETWIESEMRKISPHAYQ